jgi:hypothetical protein
MPKEDNMNQQHQPALTIGTNRLLSHENWIDPDLDDWSRQNAVLADRFSADLTGKNKSARVYNSFVVQIAGDYIWNNEGSEPSWSKLDVDGLQRDILKERLQLDDVATGNFNMTLTAFYAFLFDNGYLDRKTTYRIIRRLQDHDNAYVNDMLALASQKIACPDKPQKHMGQSSFMQRRTVEYTSGILQ